MTTNNLSRTEIKQRRNKMSSIHICSPPRTEQRIVSGKCSDCKKFSRFIQFFYEWYGPNETCLKCGRQWNDGEWMPLDFTRGIRKQNIEKAKKIYRGVYEQTR